MREYKNFTTVNSSKNVFFLEDHKDCIIDAFQQRRKLVAFSLILLTPYLYYLYKKSLRPDNSSKEKRNVFLYTID